MVNRFFRSLFSLALGLLAVLAPQLALAQEDNDTPAVAEADTLPVSAVVDYRPLLPSCARPDSNFLRFPSGVSPEMDRFVDKLDSVLLFGTGRVSILHIGGSHVQADMYTNVVRNRLDSLNNGLRPPRGLVFPFRVAKTNNPLNFSVAYGGEWDKARCSVYKPRPALGVSGISVFTSDASAWVRVVLDTDGRDRWQTGRVRLLGRTERGLLTPVFLKDTLKIFPQVVDGDFLFSLPELTDTLTFGFVRSDASSAKDVFYLDAILPDDDESGIVYHTIGVNGAAVPSYLGCEYFEQQLSRLSPDLIVMGIGINDASGPNFSDSTFCANYDSLMRIVRRVSPQCAVIFLTNNDSYRRVRRRRRVVNKNGVVAQRAFYTLAQRWQGGVWDLFEVMGGLNSMASWQKMNLAQKDKVHFTRAGYALVGNMFYDAFLNFYLQHEPTVDEY